MGLDRADQAILKQFHQNLSQEALEPTSLFFVDFDQYEGATGEDVVRLLATDVAWREAPLTTFFSGFRGSGKTTLLNQLRRDLSEMDFAVVRLDLGEMLELAAPLDVVDLIMAITGGIGEACAREGWLPESLDARSARVRIWDRIQRIRPGEGTTLDIPLGGPDDAKVSLDPFKLMRSEPAFRDRVRAFLSERELAVLNEANTLIGEFITEIKARFEKDQRHFSGFTVIVDSLDHARSDSDFAAVADALRTIFDQRLPLLKFEQCRVVYCVPAYLRLTGQVVRRAYNVKIADRAGQRFDPGYDALRAMLDKRVPAGHATSDFFTPEQIDNLIAVSGGHIRDLLRLVDEAIKRAETLPVEDVSVRLAISQVREEFLPLSRDQRAWLRSVRGKHMFDLDAGGGWATPADMISRHLVLRYPNEEAWYDVHPLVEQALDTPEE